MLTKDVIDRAFDVADSVVLVPLLGEYGILVPFLGLNNLDVFSSAEGAYP